MKFKIFTNLSKKDTTPREEFAGELKTRLLNYMKENPPVSPYVILRAENNNSFNWHLLGNLAGGVMASIVFISGTVGFASQATQPGDLLYSMKLKIDDIAVSISDSTFVKVQVANRRLGEVQSSLKLKPTPTEKVKKDIIHALNQYQTNMNSAASDIVNEPEAPSDPVVDTILSVADHNEVTIADMIMEETNEIILQNLNESIRSSREVQDSAEIKLSLEHDGEEGGNSEEATNALLPAQATTSIEIPQQPSLKSNDSAIVPEEEKPTEGGEEKESLEQPETQEPEPKESENPDVSPSLLLAPSTLSLSPEPETIELVIESTEPEGEEKKQDEEKPEEENNKIKTEEQKRSQNIIIQNGTQVASVANIITTFTPGIPTFGTSSSFNSSPIEKNIPQVEEKSTEQTEPKEPELKKEDAQKSEQVDQEKEKKLEEAGENKKLKEKRRQEMLRNFIQHFKNASQSQNSKKGWGNGNQGKK